MVVMHDQQKLLYIAMYIINPYMCDNENYRRRNNNIRLHNIIFYVQRIHLNAIYIYGLYEHTQNSDTLVVFVASLL
jgi:hypothetical protein